MDLAKSDVEKYEYIISLNRDLPTLDLGEAVELTPRRGDALFFTYCFSHIGTAKYTSVDDAVYVFM